MIWADDRSVGCAVAAVGVGVIEATTQPEEHQRNAEQDGEGDQQLRKGHS